MGFFPPRVAPPVRTEPDPRGWLAYVEDRIELPEGEEPRLAIRSLLIAETDRVRIEVRDVAVHDEVLGLTLVATFPDEHDGEALRRFEFHGWAFEEDGTPPDERLVVGLELDDGTRVFPYRTAESATAGHRVALNSGGSSTGPEQPGVLRSNFVLSPVPTGRVRVVCSLPSLGVVEADAAFDTGR